MTREIRAIVCELKAAREANFLVEQNVRTASKIPGCV